MVGQISTALAAANLNIADLLNKSARRARVHAHRHRRSVPESVLDKMRQIEGVLAVRLISAA
jgi:D-3-phosphoglycerate dehydrogenase